MKLLRYGNPGFELPGALDSDGNIRDLSGLVSDIDGDSLASITVQDIDLSGLPIVADVSRLGPVSARWVSLSALVSTMSTMLASLA